MAYTLSLAGMMEVHIRHIIYMVLVANTSSIPKHMQVILSVGIMWGERYEKGIFLHFACDNHVTLDGLSKSAGIYAEAL